MKKLLLFVLLALSFFFCSSPTEIDEAITTLTANNSLIITNNYSQTLYLHIVEAKISTVINWAPVFGDPKVSANSSITIPFEDIFNGKPGPVKAGDTIGISYWDKSNESNPTVYSTGVKL